MKDQSIDIASRVKPSPITLIPHYSYELYFIFPSKYLLYHFAPFHLSVLPTTEGYVPFFYLLLSFTHSHIVTLFY